MKVFPLTNRNPIMSPQLPDIKKNEYAVTYGDSLQRAIKYEIIEATTEHAAWHIGHSRKPKGLKVLTVVLTRQPKL